jgi:hypothetical protein
MEYPYKIYKHYDGYPSNMDNPLQAITWGLSKEATVDDVAKIVQEAIKEDERWTYFYEHVM